MGYNNTQHEVGGVGYEIWKVKYKVWDIMRCGV